jgi:hypothetical protein
MNGNGRDVCTLSARPAPSSCCTASPKTSKRDPRIDVLRGLALLMIFIDHIPNNTLGLITLHNFGFSDAAEIFVLLAGFSSFMAYGKLFERDGTESGLKRIIFRLGRLYLFQTGLLAVTVGVVWLWTGFFHQQPTIVAPILDQPVKGLAHALALHAVPNYLDILPLYIVLLAVFPLIYFGLTRRYWLALGLSAAIWLATNIDGDLNLPNWMGDGSWYFDPFSWQLLFTLGSALALLTARNDGSVPRLRWLTWTCGLYLIFAFFEAAPWADWHLPNLQPIGISPPDKSHLDILRLLNILALAYLLLSSNNFRVLARYRLLRPIEACGRHSLEVFSAGCVLALFGRLLFRTFGTASALQIAVNLGGLVAMCLLGLYLEHKRREDKAPQPQPAKAREPV